MNSNEWIFLSDLFTKDAKQTTTTQLCPQETFNDNYNFINVFLQLRK